VEYWKDDRRLAVATVGRDQESLRQTPVPEAAKAKAEGTGVETISQLGRVAIFMPLRTDIPLHETGKDRNAAKEADRLPVAPPWECPHSSEPGL
jgi:hypothetical protein